MRESPGTKHSYCAVLSCAAQQSSIVWKSAGYSVQSNTWTQELTQKSMSLHISPAPTSHTLVQAASTGLSPALAPKPPDPAVLSVPPCPAASAKPPLPAGSAEPPVPGEA